MDSILDSIKKLIGLEGDYKAFDESIIVFINGAFSTLNQMGVGPDRHFRIVDSTQTWNDWSEDSFVVEETKTYVYLHVRKLFDPPTSGSVMEAINNQLDETGWRLYTYSQKEY